jgi:predicted O-methyltransferase YrrM
MTVRPLSPGHHPGSGSGQAGPSPDAGVTYLDDITPVVSEVGWGVLGCRGRLGYEGKDVVVGGRRYAHALSSHPPARVLYLLAPGADRFCCAVALNDDVPKRVSDADFAVLADGRVVAHAQRVEAGAPPRPLEADISGARTLELKVTTARWPSCHAVWLDPLVDGCAVPAPQTFTDPLGRVEIDGTAALGPLGRCVATVASAGYADMLDDLLGSLTANGGCPDVTPVVFLLGQDAACSRVMARYDAVSVRCRPRGRRDVATKAVLYSVALVVDADKYLCLDADTVVLGDLRPLFAAIDAVNPQSILACREHGAPPGDALSAVTSIYGGRHDDARRILGPGRELAATPILNDGVFAGSRPALAALDAEIRAMPGAAAWVRAGVPWRNQCIFNLAVARLGTLCELDATYNVQLHATDVEVREHGGRTHATWQGRPVRVLHANGAGRRKRPELLGRHAGVRHPLAHSPRGDLYGAFVDALRAWLGRHGTDALAWSFYGTTDARGGRVRDPSGFPLLGALHYLVRSNGCVRVLETGTAKGVSAACLASAVAHREGGRVVTIDLVDDPLRLDLWTQLPEAMRTCINARRAECVDEMQRLLAAGERFQAALLDTDHVAEQVWREFDLARQLVCAGGLVLIHDPGWAHGTVEQALERIAREGYGVARLWLADEGAAEDDHLGLAVIENRRRGDG